MVSIEYVGPFGDNSGLAYAANQNLIALRMIKGIQVSSVAHNYSLNENKDALALSDSDKETIVEILSTISPERRTSRPPAIRIFHGIPRDLPLYNSTKDGVYKICYAVWETETWPEEYVRLMNTHCHEAWVPSGFCANGLRKSGFRGHIEEIPHPIKNIDSQTIEKINIRIHGISDNSFVFYNIMGAWQQRKGIDSLFTAYFSEFSKKEDVFLFVKSSPSSDGKIQSYIESLRRAANCGEADYLISSDDMSDEQVALIHARGNCYVSPHAAEGFGIPLFDATSWQNPLIFTDFSAPADFFNLDNSFPVDYFKVPVMQEYKYFDARQSWAKIDTFSLRQAMRYVYENRADAKQKAINAKEKVISELEHEKISEKMLERIKKITQNKERNSQ